MRAAAYQLIGFHFPALICGCGCLLLTPLSKRSSNSSSEEETVSWLKQMVVILLVLISIVERVRRFIGTINQYVLHPPAEQTFYKSEFDQLAGKMGRDSIVKVDIVDPQRYYTGFG